MVGGGPGLECHTREPGGLAHVTRTDVKTILHRRAAPGVASSDDQLGLTGGTRGNWDSASDPSRVAGAAECAAAGEAGNFASFDATSFAIAGKALPGTAGRRGAAFGHRHAVAAVADELAIRVRHALRVSAGRATGSACTRAPGASSRRAASNRPAAGCGGAASSRAATCSRIFDWACTVEVLGHAGNLAQAIVAIGLPIATANGQKEFGANLRPGRAGSKEVAAAFPRRRFAELTCRAGISGKSAAHIAGTAGATSCRSAAGLRGASSSGGTAGSHAAPNSGATTCSCRTTGLRGASSSRLAASCGGTAGLRDASGSLRTTGFHGASILHSAGLRDASGSRRTTGSRCAACSHGTAVCRKSTGCGDAAASSDTPGVHGAARPSTTSVARRSAEVRYVSIHFR
jgi:hypothetical protein